MNKAVITFALVAALALPAQASAYDHGYSGVIDPSGTILFKVAKKRGERAKVVGFTVHDVSLTCDGGKSLTTNAYFVFDMKFRKGKFHDVGYGDDDEVHVTGTVKSKRNGKLLPSDASGTIQMFGDFTTSGGFARTGCDSGVLSWTANRS